jgi:hypothetical protein
METFKYKILLETYKSKEPNSGHGKITADTLSINVLLTQDIKDIGRFIDYPFIPYDKNQPPLTYQPIPQKLLDYDNVDFNFLNLPGSNFYTSGYNYDNIRYKYKIDSDYYTNNIIVSGLTEDRLEDFTSYGYTGNSRYITGFDLNRETYINYLGDNINGVSRVISLNDYNPIIYTENADLNDVNLGTLLQSNGILFKTYFDTNRTVDNSLGFTETIPLTEMYYHGQGVNETNSVLSALTIEEYLLHITQPPKVQSDVFIDRGSTDVLQHHLQLGEITTIGDLVNYGNNYYNIIK